MTKEEKHSINMTGLHDNCRHLAYNFGIDDSWKQNGDPAGGMPKLQNLTCGNIGNNTLHLLKTY